MSGTRKEMFRVVSAVLAAGALSGGCSTSRVVLADRDFVSHPTLDFENVRFRRPETPLYDVESASNGAAPSPESTKALGNLDCERSEDFFAKLNLSAIRTCLSETPMRGTTAESKSFEIEWGLAKSGQPSLELRNPDDAPECLRTALSVIPFPRELVYVVAGESPTRGECFTSRLALDPGEVLGWELPRARIRLRVRFPLREPPRSDREVERMLRAWALSIYRGGSRENGAFHGRFLPVRYCQKCLGVPESGERGAATIPPPVSLWPSRVGGESVRWSSDSNL